VSALTVTAGSVVLDACGWAWAEALTLQREKAVPKAAASAEFKRR
jgi:hypothetical protein